MVASSRSLRLLCALVAPASMLVATASHAQSYRDVNPVPPPAPARPVAPPVPPEPVSDSQQVAIEALRGLIFEAPGTRAEERPTGGIVAKDLPLLDDAFLAGFAADLGKPLTLRTARRNSQSVVQRYRDAGLPLVDVYAPEQDVTDGVVRIVVANYRLGAVVPRGNRYFSSDLLMREMPLTKRRADPRSRRARRVSRCSTRIRIERWTWSMRPAPTTNTTDVVLQTEDRFPLRVTAGYDNAGVPQLGRDRFFAGIDYGNLFGLDQQIAYQVTVSNDFFSGNPDIEGRTNRPRFVAHAMSYSAPLPWLDRIELFGVYAQSTPRLPDSYGQTGISAQLSFRYDWRLATARDVAAASAVRLRLQALE